MAKRAAIYARVSKAYKDDDDRVTIEQQLADCEARCRDLGAVIAARFVDKDKYRSRGKLVNPSGTKSDRPAYRRMLKAAKAGEFDVIVAWKEDRLYRGLYAAVPFMELLDARSDFEVVLVKESFDRSMLQMKAAMGKYELDNIRERMIMGRRARLERGEVPGGSVRYGYTKGEDKRLAIEPEEAEVVRQVFAWYTAGENNMAIRRRLNASGIAPRRSKLWSRATIQNILTFEGYATGEYPTTLDGETYVIPCPKIVSVGAWDRAETTREDNKSYRGRNVKTDYLCRGMIVCPCGWKWHARTSRGNGNGAATAGYYACARKDHQPEKVHPDCPGTIGSQKLDDEVWRFVVAICDDPTAVQVAIQAKADELTAAQEDLEAEAARQLQALDKLEEERQWVITQARKGRISETDMESQLGALELQMMDLQRKHRDQVAALAMREQAEALQAWAGAYLDDIRAGLGALSADPADLSAHRRSVLFKSYEAARFLDKFGGDRLLALQWALLEERRKTVRTLVSEVLVVKGKSGEKVVVPKLALEIPLSYAAHAYSDQSPDYRPPGFEDSRFVLELSSQEILKGVYDDDGAAGARGMEST